MNITALIQCRDNSVRCPNKATALIDGLTMLEHLHRRMMAVGGVDGVVVSTSIKSANIIDLCQEKNWKYWAGSEDDLLSRHLGAAMTYDADVILRSTADCVFHDPQIIDAAIGVWKEQRGRADAMLSWHDNYRTFSEGLDFEIVRVDAMRRLMQDPNCPREDWLTFMDRSPKYKVMGFAYQERHGHDLHLSVDTEEDLERAREMMKIVGEDYRYSATLIAERMTRR